MYGLLKSSFTTHEHKIFANNHDLYDHWVSVKDFIISTNVASSSRISFWSGSGGSFPYFVASGKSSPGNNSPRLSTGLTTPSHASYYPEFPRVSCFISICNIVFEGINILGGTYLQANTIRYTGLRFLDFPG